MYPICESTNPTPSLPKRTRRFSLGGPKNRETASKKRDERKKKYPGRNYSVEEEPRGCFFLLGLSATSRSRLYSCMGSKIAQLEYVLSYGATTLWKKFCLFDLMKVSRDFAPGCVLNTVVAGCNRICLREWFAELQFDLPSNTTI